MGLTETCKDPNFMHSQTHEHFKNIFQIKVLFLMGQNCKQKTKTIMRHDSQILKQSFVNTNRTKSTPCLCWL